MIRKIRFYVVLYLSLPFMLWAQAKSGPVSSELPLREKLARLYDEGASAALESACRKLAANADRRPENAGWGYVYLGELAIKKRQMDSASLFYQQAESLFEMSRTAIGLAAVAHGRGGIAIQEGDFEVAAQSFRRAWSRLESQYEQDPMAYQVQQDFSILYSVRNQHDSAMLALKKALAIAQELDDMDKIKTTYAQISSSYYSLGQLDSALRYYEPLIEIREAVGSPAALLDDLSMIGKLSAERGRYLDAQSYWLRALRLAEERQDTFFMMRLCTDLAGLYAKQELWEDALSYSERGLGLARLRAIRLIEAQNLKQLGYIYHHTGAADRALERYNEALQIFEQLNNRMQTADVRLTIGRIYRDQLDVDRALGNVQAAIRLQEGTGDAIGLANAQLLLGELYLLNGNPGLALQPLEKSSRTGASLNSKSVERDALALLALAYQNLGNYQAAFEHLSDFHILNDSLQSVATAKTLNALQLEYETEIKDQQLLAQQTELRLKESQIKRRNFQLLLSVVGLGLLTVLLGSLYFIYQKNRQLAQQRIAVMEKEQETQRLRAVIEGEEKERRRMARDLHDGLGALLATVKMWINALYKEEPQLQQSSTCRKAENLIDNACEAVRAISHNVAPNVLEQLGLVAAIEEMCDSVGRINALEVDFMAHGLEEDFDDPLRLTIYRIIQELLRNIVKHAQAQSVIVQLTAEEDTIMLVVEDDGRGFDPQLRDHTSGLGLESVHSRVAYLDGQVALETAPGAGTTFTIEIPKIHRYDQHINR